MNGDFFHTEKLLDYYKRQIWKMLVLFENKDEYGYKHAMRIHSELKKIPQIIPELKGNHKLSVVILKVGVLVDKLKSLDGEHWFVKNHTMESLNLIDEILEDLK